MYRIMKELRNTSGFAWNETTQCMDAEDSVWDDLLKVMFSSKCFSILISNIYLIIKFFQCVEK